MEEKKDMPDGITWPRYKSGGPVGIGDRFTDRAGIERAVMCIRFYDDKFCIHAYDDTLHYYNYGEPVTPAPVPAADGKPLREGETVWDTKGNGPYIIKKIENDGVVRIDGSDLGYFGSEFVHERPDTWERIEEDAGCTATKYNERRGTIFTTKQQVARDLVRRAKKLAERGE